MEVLSKTDNDFRKFWSHMPWEAKDETVIVLKGHLLVEDLLREYCASKLKSESELTKAKLTFPQVMHVAKAMMSYQGPSWIWGGCVKLNKLRNDLAHNLTPEDYSAKQEEFIRFVFSEAKPSDQLLSSAPSEHQKLGLAIFLLYTSLSIHLSFKPAGLLGLLGSLGP